MKISMIIPAYDEALGIGLVVKEVPRDLVGEIIVVDNASSDGTAEVARAAGARVVHEGRRGYGSACLRGVRSLGECDVVVFLDGDHSGDPAAIPSLVRPIVEATADLVIGSRIPALRAAGSMTFAQIFGNWLATRMIWLLWGFRYKDLGPFRAISRSALERLGMKDPDYGWTVEMQVRALEKGLRVAEVPVANRRRIGKSKISGTLRGTVMAGYKIIYTILKLGLVRD